MNRQVTKSLLCQSTVGVLPIQTTACPVLYPFCQWKMQTWTETTIPFTGLLYFKVVDREHLIAPCYSLSSNLNDFSNMKFSVSSLIKASYVLSSLSWWVAQQSAVEQNSATLHWICYL